MTMTSKLSNNLANGAPKVNRNQKKKKTRPKFGEDTVGPPGVVTSVWEIGLSVRILALASDFILKKMLLFSCQFGTNLIRWHTNISKCAMKLKFKFTVP